MRTLAGVATLLVAALLSLLYFYRRRAYILCWVAGWILIGASRLLAARELPGERTSLAAYGLSQFLAIVGALVFVLSADAYRARLRLRRHHALVLLPLVIWFALAPLALGPSRSSRRAICSRPARWPPPAWRTCCSCATRACVGAAVVGATMLLLAASNAWLAIVGGRPGRRRASSARPS